jgi:glycosyltransferase involved in cell wall biosynthesis
MNATRSLRCVLVTPARNEEAFLGATIEAVVAQTVRPLRWVIVSDGSTDGTDALIAKAAAQHDWIEPLRMPDRRDRSFAAKASCFQAGYERLKALEFDLVANLDADITFESDYFDFLLGRFEALPRLGVAGTPFVEAGQASHTYAHEGANLEHVSGACQVFRRECFEAVGGYVPIRGGAIDWIAVTTARMKGWQTRTFTDKVCEHHRPIGTAGASVLGARFHYGHKAYYVGGHPLWELLRGVFQMRRAPYVLGGLWFLAGYAWSAAIRAPRPVSAELIQFHRREQLARLRQRFAIGRLGAVGK